jgi:branched-chain amino acid transport system substrate-binding protein
MGTTNGHGRMRALAATAAALLLGLACGTTQGTSSGPAKSDPGVSGSELLIGSTFPLSGAASAYAVIQRGSTAYFSSLNDQGGVNGRKISYKVYDDGYDPSRSVPLVRQLVTQDNVFLVFNELGTAVNLATREYLNQEHVPHLFVATGSSHWGADYKQYPYTVGFQPDYVSEGTIYGHDILKNHPTAKIGILRQNDDYGKDYVNGLKNGLGSKAGSLIVDEETYEANAADVFAQVAALKAKGADVLYIVCTPRFATQAIATAAKSGWKPSIYLNNVSAQVPTVKAAVASSTPDAADGMVSTAYLKDPADRNRWSGDAGMQLYMRLMAKYCGGCDVNDGNYLYGMAVAWTFQKVLERAGRDGVTRANVMKIARSLNLKDNPFLLPGVAIRTSGDQQFPITQEALEHWQNGAWVVDSQIQSSR